MSLSRTENGIWASGAGQEVELLRGCSDVDIMITPFTNTLPIRRLGLKSGEAREIAVAYFGLPDFVPTRFEQRYTCLELRNNGGLYRYENLQSDFRADLNVDGDGLVVEYPGIFAMDAKRRLPST